MERRQQHFPRWIVALVFVGIIAGGVWGFHSQNAISQDSSVTGYRESGSQPGAEPSRVMGHDQCIDCHRSEFIRWKESKHAQRAYDLLRTAPSSPKYAEALGIDLGRIASADSACVRCHATVQQLDDGQQITLAGVSCEACHNGSGGVDGWLNAHASYGFTGARREDESDAHRQQRLERCFAAGQFRSDDTYDLAKRCLECHLVGNEALVNAGHPAGNTFDFAVKSLGEVRHNFHLNQGFNPEVSTLWLSPLWTGGDRTAAGRKRLMFVAGALADLEAGLRGLAKATDEDGDYYEAMLDRVVDGYEFLEDDIIGALEDEDVEIDELGEILSAVEDIYTLLDDEEYVIDEHRSDAIAAAKEVARLGRQFAYQENGNRLEAIDEPEAPEE